MSDEKKQKVWEGRHALATDNLSSKIKVLKDFVHKGIPWLRDIEGNYLRDPDTGSKLLDCYPKSKFQFSKWTMEGIPDPYEQKLEGELLAINPTDKSKNRSDKLLINCQWVRNDIEKRLDCFFTTHGQDTLTNRDDELEATVAKLLADIKIVAKNQLCEIDHKAESDRWKAAADSQAQFVIDALKTKSDLEKKVKLLERAQKEAKKVLILKDTEIAQLTKQISEIGRFPSVKGGRND